MKPPKCYFCSNKDGVKLIEFADYEDLEFIPGMTGHAKGLEWVCKEHREKGIDFSTVTAEQAWKRFNEMEDGNY
jgi:hypothetical protein